MRSLIIIGNGEVNEDYTSFVDNADYVVRFNWLQNYNKNTGKRVNALALASAKTHIDNYLEPSSQYQNNHICLFKSILMRIDLLLFPIPDANRNCTNRLRRIAFFVDSFSLQKKSRKYYFCEDSYLDDLGVQKKPLHQIVPSSGYTVIRNILDDSSFNNFDIYLLGFNWRGWQGHSWSKEAKVIHHLVASSQRITIL